MKHLEVIQINVEWQINFGLTLNLFNTKLIAGRKILKIIKKQKRFWTTMNSAVAVDWGLQGCWDLLRPFGFSVVPPVRDCSVASAQRAVGL